MRAALVLGYCDRVELVAPVRAQRGSTQSAGGVRRRPARVQLPGRPAVRRPRDHGHATSTALPGRKRTDYMANRWGPSSAGVTPAAVARGGLVAHHPQCMSVIRAVGGLAVILMSLPAWSARPSARPYAWPSSGSCMGTCAGSSIGSRDGRTCSSRGRRRPGRDAARHVPRALRARRADIFHATTGPCLTRRVRRPSPSSRAPTITRRSSRPAPPRQST